MTAGVFRPHVFGHPWLPEIPMSWRIKPFRHCFSENGETNGHSPVGTMLSVSGFRGIETKTYEAESQRRTSEMVADYRVVRPGQLVVNTMWMNYAGLGFSELTGHVSPAYRVYDLKEDASRRYLHHLLRSSTYVNAYTGHLRGIRPNSLQMDRNTLMNWPIVLPPRSQQDAIADYLDRETAQIDTLIHEQQRLIELLRERRSAVVERSVVELDWQVPLRTLSDLIQTGPFGSQLKSSEYIDDGTAVINPSHLLQGRVAADRRIAVGPAKARELARHALREGDLVVARRGELGRCAVVTQEAAGALCGTGSAIIRPRRSMLDPSFLAVIFSSRKNRETLSLQSVGSTMDNLNSDILGALRVPAPSLDQQRAIVSTISKQTSVIDTLITEAEGFIELARERRSALITAVVTGQIDVSEAA